MTSQAIKLGGMDHLALPTANPARGETFYCQVLGFHVVPRPSFSFDGRWLVHDEVSVMLHLIHNGDHRVATGEINTRAGHFALRCPDIDGAIRVLTEHHVEFVEKRLPDHGYRQLFFRDPDGNVIELGEWPEKS